MSSKTPDSYASTDINETDDLRLAVKDLNQSIAYLSKMILQLQRSINAKPGKPPSPQKKPETIH